MRVRPQCDSWAERIPWVFVSHWSYSDAGSEEDEDWGKGRDMVTSRFLRATWAAQLLCHQAPKRGHGTCFGNAHTPGRWLPRVSPIEAIPESVGFLLVLTCLVHCSLSRSVSHSLSLFLAISPCLSLSLSLTLTRAHALSLLFQDKKRTYPKHVQIRNILLLMLLTAIIVCIMYLV